VKAWFCLLVAASILAGGCASADLAGRPPTLQVALGNGVIRSFYVQSLHDMQTLAVDTDANGQVIQRLRALTDERLASIPVGMDSAELLKLIGPPYRKVEFERQVQTAWDYRYTDSWGYIVEFSVMLDARGKVVSKVSRRIDARDNLP